MPRSGLIVTARPSGWNATVVLKSITDAFKVKESCRISFIVLKS